MLRTRLHQTDAEGRVKTGERQLQHPAESLPRECAAHSAGLPEVSASTPLSSATLRNIWKIRAEDNVSTYFMKELITSDHIKESHIRPLRQRRWRSHLSTTILSEPLLREAVQGRKHAFRCDSSRCRQFFPKSNNITWQKFVLNL